ncbi:RNA polymerase sigma factor [Oleiagrimonas citrea]
MLANTVPSAFMDERRDNDHALMQAYVAGDAEAFRILYERHRGGLYRFILYRVDTRHTADELFQETWSRVIASRERYRPKAQFRTWLYQIAHNLVIDSYRRKRPQASGEENERILRMQVADEGEQPEQALSTFEQRRRLQRALEHLPDEQRTVFLLRMEKGLGLEEIATITGCGRETAKSRLRYALKRIRELVTP